MAHRRARLSRDIRLRPKWIVDVQAAAAVLSEACDAALSVFSKKSPHPELAKAPALLTASAR
jgi:hypothetical protein